MSVAVKKLEGVESVEVSLSKASAVITLRADNKITLPLLRRTNRNGGYPTRDARVTARGIIAERDGRPVLDLLNGSAIELTARPADAPAKPVEVTGISREDSKKVERLTIAAINDR